LKKYLPILKNSPFFKGLTDNEILSVLHCVEAVTVSKEKDSYIFRAADSTQVMGLVLSGCVLIIQEDLWGHRNILSKCHAGDFFGEPYAASPGAVLNISVVADEDCEIVFLNIQKLLVTCPTACGHHQKLIRNLVSVLANKILILNDKITHVGKRTTREKLLSYLSAESIRHSSLSFDIPFDRQQLADYLCIDRAAMSTEISKLQKEGFIKTHRNHFEVLCNNDTNVSDISFCRGAENVE
jgi:CRP/FNR family cyclic AMP-dependent transcriptional regulator